jgi:hypothetical protein
LLGLQVFVGHGAYALVPSPGLHALAARFRGAVPIAKGR